jgi:hypothetical protein
MNSRRSALQGQPDGHHDHGVADLRQSTAEHHDVSSFHGRKLHRRRDHVLAGYIASEETWSSFSDEWKALLPHAVLGKNGLYRFKMRDMARFGDGEEWIASHPWLLP